jgi:hypothetical protein
MAPRGKSQTSLLLVTALLLGLAVLVDAPVVNAARPANALTFSTISDLEPTDSGVFVIGRPGRDEVAVHEPNGNFASVITGLVDTRSLDLSDDGGNLFVAMGSAGSIGVIDVASRTLVDVIDVAGKPTIVRQAGSRLIYSDERKSGTIAVRTYDLADGSAGSLPLTAGRFLMDAVAAEPQLVVIGYGPRNRARHLSVLDVSMDDPVIVQSTDVPELSDLALTSDASALVVGERAGSPSSARVYATSNLGLLGTLPGVPGSIDGVATTGERNAAAWMTTKKSGVFLRVHSLADDAPIRIGRDASVLRHGIAFSPDGSLLYIAKDVDREHDFERLTAIASPTMTPSSIITHAKQKVRVGETVVVSGVVRDGLGAVPDGATIRAQRVSRAGTKSLGDIIPRADGSFTLRDTPPRLGKYRYRFSYSGNSTTLPTSASERVSIIKLKPALRISTDQKIYRYHQTAHIRVRLGATESNRRVAIVADPAHGRPRVIERGRVDNDGVLRTRYRLTYNTTFVAKFAGDDLYQRRHVSRAVGTKTDITTSMRGWYAVRDGVYLYHQGESGQLHIEVTPDMTGSLAIYPTEILVQGHWEPTFWGGAEIPVGKGSQFTASVGGYTLDHPATLRCRAIVYGGGTNWGTGSRWEKFRVG